MQSYLLVFSGQSTVLPSDICLFYLVRHFGIAFASFNEVEFNKYSDIY